MSQIAYISNTNSIDLYALQDKATKNYINGDWSPTPAVNCSVEDKDGNVLLVTSPMTYVANTNGQWRVLLPAATALQNGVKYYAIIDVDASDQVTERKAHWREEFMAETRDS